MILISREDAKVQGLKRYFTGLPCVKGHVAERNVGSNNECVECKRLRDSAYTERNKDKKREYDREYRKVNSEHRLSLKAKWREANPDYNKNYSVRYYAENTVAFAEYRLKHRDLRNAQKRAWNKNNKVRIREYSRVFARKKKLTSLNYRIACALRTRLAVAIRTGRGVSAVRDLGCTIEFLRQHLEKQFQPGMNWENWGVKGWHIDHERPLASYDLSDPIQAARACHYTNLRPMWAFDNLSKGASWTDADASQASAG